MRLGIPPMRKCKCFFPGGKGVFVATDGFASTGGCKQSDWRRTWGIASQGVSPLTESRKTVLRLGMKNGALDPPLLPNPWPGNNVSIGLILAGFEPYAESSRPSHGYRISLGGVVAPLAPHPRSR